MSRSPIKDDLGRWQTQRDRLPWLDETPPPPFRAQTIGGLLRDTIRDLRLEQDVLLDQLHSDWPRLVGPQVAAHARPGPLQNGTLFVYVKHNLWLTELAPGAPHILKKIHDTFGKEQIRNIKLRMDPDT